MSKMSVICPNCGKALCTFKEGSLFGHCNKCGSNVERLLDNSAKAYDMSAEADENLAMAYDRTEMCSSLVLPSRQNMSLEAFDHEVERIMDEIMVFNEVMNDILSMMDDMPDEKKYRTCELCYGMVDRIYKQFAKFTVEFSNYGMDVRLRQVYETFTAKFKSYSAELERKQDNLLKAYWADRQDEYRELQAKLDDAKDRKLRIPMYNLQANWEADNEIPELEKKLYCIRM